MDKVIIPIHSFVDLITNSSSEIFVQADENTVKAIKKLVNDLLTVGGGQVTADDLFTFDIVYCCQDKDWEDVYFTEDEIEAKKKALGDKEDEWTWGNDRETPTISVRVETKDKTGGKAAKDAAKVLSNLTGLFEIDSTYG